MTILWSSADSQGVGVIFVVFRLKNKAAGPNEPAA
jgi:hypothetical protein